MSSNKNLKRTQSAATTDATGRTVTRSPGTVAAYRARRPMLARKAGSDQPHHLVNWFLSQHGAWAASTIEQYKACIFQTIDDTPDMLKAERLWLQQRLKARPDPREKSEPPRTSARKRKAVRYVEYQNLIDALIATKKTDDEIAAQYLRFNAYLFLRPVEWQTIEIKGGLLTITNAKATNGRACGKTRKRDLQNCRAEEVVSLEKFIVVLKGRANSVGGYKRLWSRLASRIARACMRLGIKRISLYTSRHVGIANAKTWMTPLQLAVSAGHKTTVTARRHYSKGRSGWGPKIRRVFWPAQVASHNITISMDAARVAELASSRKPGDAHAPQQIKARKPAETTLRTAILPKNASASANKGDSARKLLHPSRVSPGSSLHFTQKGSQMRRFPNQIEYPAPQAPPKEPPEDDDEGPSFTM